MLTHERIVDAVAKQAKRFPLKKVSYFGSYADGCATEESDLDLLVEFTAPPTVSLLTIFGLQNDLEDELNIPVDVVTMPISEKSYIEIGHTVDIYRDGATILDDGRKQLENVQPRRISMKDRDKNILLKLKEKAEVLPTLTDGYDLQGFLGSEVLKLAVSMSLINLGELVNRLSDETKQQNPAVAWSAIVRLRNVAAHGYDELKMENIWKIVTEDVPPFLTQISEILQRTGDEGRKNITASFPDKRDISLERGW